MAKTEEKSINVAPIIMNNALKKGQVLKLFCHNIKASGHQDIVHMMKGFSQDVLPSLRKDHFNIIFIDGDHSYSGIKKDLEMASQLLVDGGVICGDDLDLQWDEVGSKFCKNT